jgi:hypothetical protein
MPRTYAKRIIAMSYVVKYAVNRTAVERVAEYLRYTSEYAVKADVRECVRFLVWGAVENAIDKHVQASLADSAATIENVVTDVIFHDLGER